MASKWARYTRQTFYSVALRRYAEAELLLNPPHAYCDGAVTCGLLAAECALKATLLHGHRANSPDELPEDIRKDVFEGQSGHAMPILWDRQHSMVKSTQTDELSDAISHLNGPNRYEHRYGAKKPLRVHASPYVEYCKVVVAWMKAVIQ